MNLLSDQEARLQENVAKAETREAALRDRLAEVGTCWDNHCWVGWRWVAVVGAYRDRVTFTEGS